MSSLDDKFSMLNGQSKGSRQGVFFSYDHCPRKLGSKVRINGL